jgi:UDP-N-acetylmuramoyl-tripeptide--D-alanyl-D-alanine ligase
MKSFFKQIVVGILTWEAKKTLARFEPRVIAITGSVGKTSAKDAVAHVLSAQFKVRKSEKSFNSEIGLPLTILGLPNAWGSGWRWTANILKGFYIAFWSKKYPEWLGLEIGAEHPGDIESVSKWLKSDIVVITKLPDMPVHVEFFASPEEVSREKLFLLDTLKHDGTAILNYEDAGSIRKARELPVEVVTVGEDFGADLRASNYQIVYRAGMPEGINFKVDYESRSFPADVRGVLGHGYVASALFAVAVGKALGMNMIDMVKSVSSFTAPKGRMRIIEGLKNSIIIDDSYNSSPVALRSALDSLRTLDATGKKIAVLGDMAELGRYSEEEHKKAGRYASGIADFLVTVGVRARLIAEGALEGGLSEKDILQFDSARRAGKEVELLLSDGDAVLIKGSQSIRMERVTEEIMAYPEKKKFLLVRQEEEWLSKP